MQTQIGKQYFGRVIVFKTVPVEEFCEALLPHMSAPGMELNNAELLASFSTGIIHCEPALQNKFFRVI